MFAKNAEIGSQCYLTGGYTIPIKEMHPLGVPEPCDSFALILIPVLSAQFSCAWVSQKWSNHIGLSFHILMTGCELSQIQRR